MSWKETDPISLWKNSTVIPLLPSPKSNEPRTSDDKVENDENEKAMPVIRRIAGSRSTFMESVLTMPPSQRSKYLHHLFKVWPNQIEKNSLTAPLYSQFCTSWFSNVYIASKINADVFLLQKNVGIIESIKKCPKLPFFTTLGFYGVIFPIGYMDIFVYRPLIEQEVPPTRLITFSNIFLMSMITNIIGPIFSTSQLAHSIFTINQKRVDSLAQNFMDFWIVSYEYSRSIRRILPLLVIFYGALAWTCTEAMHWGRERIHEKADIEPESIRHLISTTDPRNSVDRFFDGLRDKLAIFTQPLDEFFAEIRSSFPRPGSFSLFGKKDV